MDGSQVFITDSAEETQRVAASLADTLTPPALLCLYGDLGSGKTTFVQGFAKRLGIRQRIISPSFLLMRQYLTPSGKILYHIDAYRDIVDGIEDILRDTNAFVIVEWANHMEHILPKQRIEIRIQPIDEQKRTIAIQRYDHPSN